MRVNIGPYLNNGSKKKKRAISIKIHGYDTWNADHTMALIIHPILLRMKKDKQGIPYVKDEDLPDDLIKITSSDDLSNLGNMTRRWDYILDSMIWSFEQIISDGEWEEQFHKNGFDKEGYIKYSDRISHGLVLFGKYYQALWT